MCACVRARAAAAALSEAATHRPLKQEADGRKQVIKPEPDDEKLIHLNICVNINTCFCVFVTTAQSVIVF